MLRSSGGRSAVGADVRLAPRELAWLGGAALLALAARAPSLLLGGRIWGEEGRFLEAALSRSIPEMLVWRYGDVGYYVLPLNACAAIAAALPLELAPLVFCTGGAMALLLPLALAALDPVWRTRARLLPLALIVLLTMPSAEVWLNVASAQFPIALGTAVLLFTETGEAKPRALRLAALSFAGFSGVASLLLAPLFALRALAERSRARAHQFAVLGACGALQLALMQSAPAATARERLDSPVTLAAISVSRQWLQFSAYPLARFSGFEREGIAKRVLHAVQVPGTAQLGILAAAVGLHAALAALVACSASSAARWALASSMTLLVGTLFATRESSAQLIHPVYAMRYFYAPNALLLIALLEAARGAPGLRVRRGALAALAWILLVGAFEWTRREPFFFARSNWYAAVRAWRADPTRAIEHAPVGWKLVPPRGEIEREGAR
jgi:hypothetical protein